MAGVRVHVVMPRVMVERVDASLSDGVSRGEWIRRAVERALEPLTVCACGRRYDHETTAECRPVPAPAEQPERVPEAYHEMVARNVPVSRGFRPYPKGGK